MHENSLVIEGNWNSGRSISAAVRLAMRILLYLVVGLSTCTQSLGFGLEPSLTLGRKDLSRSGISKLICRAGDHNEPSRREVFSRALQAAGLFAGLPSVANAGFFDSGDNQVGWGQAQKA